MWLALLLSLANVSGLFDNLPPSWGYLDTVVCGPSVEEVMYTDAGSCKTTACFFKDTTFLFVDCDNHELQCVQMSADDKGMTKIDDCPARSY
jgi:hypothetical protein